MNLRHVSVFSFLILLIAGCDSYDQVDFEEQIVVEGYLEAGDELGMIRLSRTAPLNSSYDFASLAVSGAVVKVHLLDADGQIEHTYEYIESKRRPGSYKDPSDDAALPRRTYRLEVLAPGHSELITAQTTVPAPLEVLRVSADSLTYQGDEQLEIDIAPDVIGTRQRVFAFTTRAQDVREENLTPFAAAILDQGDIDLEDVSTGSSPLLNEANYEVTKEGTIRIRMPWIAITFFGPNRLSISAVDDNYFDFRRTADVQQGGSTLAPGEIPNVLEHIQGGTGIFGSYAAATTALYVARPGEIDRTAASE